MSSSLLSKHLLFKLRRAALVAALTLAALAVLSGCAKQISVSGTEFPSDAKELSLRKELGIGEPGSVSKTENFSVSWRKLMPPPRRFPPRRMNPSPDMSATRSG